MGSYAAMSQEVSFDGWLVMGGWGVEVGVEEEEEEDEDEGLEIEEEVCK